MRMVMERWNILNQRWEHELDGARSRNWNWRLCDVAAGWNAARAWLLRDGLGLRSLSAGVNAARERGHLVLSLVCCDEPADRDGSVRYWQRHRTRESRTRK